MQYLAAEVAAEAVVPWRYVTAAPAAAAAWCMMAAPAAAAGCHTVTHAPTQSQCAHALPAARSACLAAGGVGGCRCVVGQQRSELPVAGTVGRGWRPAEQQQGEKEGGRGARKGAAASEGCERYHQHSSKLQPIAPAAACSKAIVLHSQAAARQQAAPPQTAPAGCEGQGTPTRSERCGSNLCAGRPVGLGFSEATLGRWLLRFLELLLLGRRQRLGLLLSWLALIPGLLRACLAGRWARRGPVATTTIACVR